MERDTAPDRARRSWEKFLDSESLRFSLTIGSVYLTAYEFLMEALVERLKSFYASEWTPEGVVPGPDYKAKVLTRHKMVYLASAEWFVEMGALDTADIEALRKVRDHRNFIAHNIPRIILEAGVEVDPHLLGEIVRLVSKLDRWWLRYVEIPSNPDFDDKEPSEEEIEDAFSMRMYSLHLLISFVSGDDGPLRDLHTSFKDAWPEEAEASDAGIQEE
ncbi:MAG TPA: hypothetical protein VGB24_24340 [Longimicrobium sp.]|jgi:hypothetical protein|uniref:hypothetical protein n=1 Tax=Longimicrobium sp. TaxID=2029185 RepID=UPI002EDA057C